MISFVCPFCAHPFTVQDSLSGRGMSCPQCGGAVTVPGTGPIHPMPARPEDVAHLQTGSHKAERASRWAFWMGVGSLCCSCVGAPLSYIFGIVALTRPGLDPLLAGPIRRRAILGMGLATLFLVGQFVGLILWGKRLKDEEDREMARADAAYEAKNWDEAKPLYEKYQDRGTNDLKAKCHARIGRIHFAKGDVAAAQEAFRQAVDAKNDYEFKCDDEEANKLYRKTLSAYRREAGNLNFRTKVLGDKKNDVSVSSWRVKGKRLRYDIQFKVKPEQVKVSMVLYGANEVPLERFNWDQTGSKTDMEYSVEFDGDWDEVIEAIVYVETP